MVNSRFICLFSIIFGCASSLIAQNDVTVVTPVGRVLGTKEHVRIDGKDRLVSKFLGIPYAESTAGRNRFQKPIPKASFSETLDARIAPKACFQSSLAEMEFTKDVYGITGYSEDCLSVSIYIPGDVNTINWKSVMLWIHGGGFTSGAGPILDASVLSAFGDVIVVTINYRLGMFGFLRDSGGNFIGNQGLWDQQLAIKWVHDNIHSFKGLSDEITIFGESAGGASVLLQALFIGNRGLIKRVIAESGSSIGYWPVLDESASDTFIADQGCMSKDTDVLMCLQAKEAGSLISNVSYSFAPIVDGDFLKAKPKEIIFGNSSNTSAARDFYSSLDIIAGVNNNEGIVYLLIWQELYGLSDLDFELTRKMFKNDFVPWVVNNSMQTGDEATKNVLNNIIDFVYTNWTDPTDTINVRRSATDMWNDLAFFVGAHQAVEGHSLLNGTGRAYLYEFAVDAVEHATPVPSWFTGSTHADELGYVFGYPLLESKTWFDGTTVNFTSTDEAIARTMMYTWSTFAKSGITAVHATFDHLWPEYNLGTQQYLKFTNKPQPTSEQRFYPHRMWLWNTMIPSILNTDVRL